MNEHAFWKSCEETQFSSKYYLKTLLGVGGFGAVFKADEVVADRCIRTVALKIFNPFQTPNLDAFIQEFQTTANLRHPHLIETYAVEEGKLQGAIDALGLVMELAKEDLAKRLERSSFTIEEAKVAVRHVAEALKFLHSKGIIHRDIKPLNIMAVGSGSNLTWKVGDLGIVRVLGDKTAPITTNRQGSPFYAPPEAFIGEVSAATDMWALGITITQVLMGQLPFPGPSEAQVMHQVINQEPNLSPMEEPFEAIVRGCLMKDRNERWTVSQVLETLNPPDSYREERFTPVSHELDINTVPLRSAKGVNYIRLQNFLKRKRWKAADRETKRLMCKVANRQNDLSKEDIQRFPCVDLQTIDHLWFAASQGKYGFTAQKEIYVRCGAKLDGDYPGDIIWHKFADEIGWRVNGQWRTYSQLNWNVTPLIPGHLPRMWNVVRWGAPALAWRITDCNS
jgi:serine/threonine protein kinase